MLSDGIIWLLFRGGRTTNENKKNAGIFIVTAVKTSNLTKH
jgi:hypothetical protein